MMAATTPNSNPITPDRVNSGAPNHIIDPGVRPGRGFDEPARGFDEPAHGFDEPDVTRVEIVIPALLEVFYVPVHAPSSDPRLRCRPRRGCVYRLIPHTDDDDREYLYLQDSRGRYVGHISNQDFLTGSAALMEALFNGLVLCIQIMRVRGRYAVGSACCGEELRIIVPVRDDRDGD
ncbi:hypothetical protein F4861DRAFT_519019, partial [Xylaria intraflava]